MSDGAQVVHVLTPEQLDRVIAKAKREERALCVELIQAHRADLESRGRYLACDILTGALKALVVRSPL